MKISDLIAIAVFATLGFHADTIMETMLSIDVQSYANDLKQVVDVARNEGIGCVFAEDGSPQQVKCGLARYMNRI